MLKDKTNVELVNMIGDPSFSNEQSQIKEEILQRLTESPLRKAYASWIGDPEVLDSLILTEDEREKAVGLMIENGWLNEQISDVANDSIQEVISDREDTFLDSYKKEINR